MADNEWKIRCQNEWNITGISMPDSVDWKFVYEAKPLGRNLLRNPAPHGVTHDSPPPEPELADEPPRDEPPRSEPEGDYTGWTTSVEDLPYDNSGIPPGVVVCYMPQFSWFTLEQKIDLKAEGLWDELLDHQPDILIQDRYEESQLHESIYQLHVKLLGGDGQVISEHTASPTEDLSTYSHTWKEVSHVFSGYGKGVRYVHFLHRLKNKYMVEFFPTLVTGSSVIVKAT